jgi:type IV secretory pathway VirB10-like protein
MSPDARKRGYTKDFLLAAALVTTGLVISGLSLIELRARDPQQMAQATQPLQSTPDAETKPSVPSEPVTTGTRPSGVPPQPAHPDAEAQKAGAQPALPPAPAEKTAPPIKER